MRKRFKYILAIDPSGNFGEGKGTTGYVVINAFNQNIVEHGTISAKEYECAEEFWQAQLEMVAWITKKYKSIGVVIEDYYLYQHKALEQSNSRMETCRVIGLLQHYCWKHKVYFVFQRAVDVKTRWSNEVLQKKGLYPYKFIKHEIDAYRHALHFNNFKNNEEGVHYARKQHYRNVPQKTKAY